MSECEVVSEESALLNGSEGRILSFLKDLYLTEIRWKHFLHTWASMESSLHSLPAPKNLLALCYKGEIDTKVKSRRS